MLIEDTMLGLLSDSLQSESQNHLTGAAWELVACKLTPLTGDD